MLRRELPSLGLGNHAAFCNADQGIVRLEILAPAIERLVRCNERGAVRIGEVEQTGFDLLFFRSPVALQFDVKPVAEQGRELGTPRGSQVRLPGDKREIERPTGATGE